MAGELVSFRKIVDGRTCLDWYVLNVGDEQVVFSQSLKSWCETSAEEERPPQFRFAIPRKSGEEEDQAGRSADSWERTAEELLSRWAGLS